MEKKLRNDKILYLALIGLITGFINGLFGGGGGMIIVPALSLILGYGVKESHATAILIILPLSVLSGILYSVFGNIDFNKLWQVSIGVLGGGILGAFLLNKLKCKWISLIFALVMAVAGVKMLFF